MQIKFFCPRWGSELINWDEFCDKVKNAGYDGIEGGISPNSHENREMKIALDKHQLLWIGQFYQSFESDFEIHKKQFKQQLYQILESAPILIDSQTGKDFFTAQQNKALFEIAASITKETGIEIAHETHRNKALFAAHISRDLLVQNPYVKITADFSHWCNVSESLLEQQQDALAIAIDRAIHIHARIGHAQSAQVSDPRAAEWTNELKKHLSWWDRIVAARLQIGTDLLAITPEFGPYPYMTALPFTNMPIANQWEINLYMMELLKERYQNHVNF